MLVSAIENESAMSTRSICTSPPSLPPAPREHPCRLSLSTKLSSLCGTATDSLFPHVVMLHFSASLSVHPASFPLLCPQVFGTALLRGLMGLLGAALGSADGQAGRAPIIPRVGTDPGLSSHPQLCWALPVSWNQGQSQWTSVSCSESDRERLGA